MKDNSVEYNSSKVTKENNQQTIIKNKYIESDKIMNECIREIFYDINSDIWEY